MFSTHCIWFIINFFKIKYLYILSLTHSDLRNSTLLHYSDQMTYSMTIIVLKVTFKPGKCYPNSHNLMQILLWPHVRAVYVTMVWVTANWVVPHAQLEVAYKSSECSHLRTACVQLQQLIPHPWHAASLHIHQALTRVIIAVVDIISEEMLSQRKCRYCVVVLAAIYKTRLVQYICVRSGSGHK